MSGCWKRWGVWVLTMLLAWAVMVPAYGADSPGLAGGVQRVFDQAGLFSTDQTPALEQELLDLKDRIKMDAVVVTTRDTKGKSARDYADDFYDQGGFGTHGDYSGVLFLIDMENRELHISTYGAMVRFLTDSRIEEILDQVYGYAQEEDYMGAAKQFAESVQYYYQKGIPGGQFLYDTETGRISRYRSIRWYEALMALAVSGVCGLTACAGIKREYAMKSQRKQAGNYQMAYRANSAFQFHNQLDQMTNSFVTQRMIPRNTGASGGMGRGGGGMSGGGRSSTHTSSSGRSHGGGGRKF